MIVYYNDSILSYVSSIRKYYGLKNSYESNIKFDEVINLRKPHNIILMLIDGMGANLINRKLDKDCFLKKNMLYVTTTVFPTATTAATTSIRNGKAPCENAWLGWNQYFKEVDDNIVLFRSTGFYNDKKYEDSFAWKTLPIKYIEDELNEINIKSKVIFPKTIYDNGAEDFDDLCNQTLKASKDTNTKFIYSYWDSYDSYMHKYGPSSKICDSYLEHINYEIENLSNSLSKDTMLVVISDHGQVDVKSEYNLCGSKFDKYLRIKPSLEPRACVFFIKEGMHDEFEKEFKNEFEDNFILLNHTQIIDTHLFGDKNNHPRFEEFIGDFIAIAKTNMVLAYKDKLIETLKGQHGGAMDDEIYVPVIVY